MKFIKYPSIKRLTERAINNVRGVNVELPEFMVTEKLHGANMGIYSNGTDFRIASREGFVRDGIKFYNGRAVADKYKEAILQHAKDATVELKASGIDGEVVSIYFGELFGGSIHKGTPYSQEQDFVLFDFFIVVDDTGNNREILHQNGCKHFEILEEEGLLVCRAYDKPTAIKNIASAIGCRPIEILFIGSFEGAILVKNDFESKYVCPQKVKESGVEAHGQEAVDYLCITEGVIIEPVYPVNYFGDTFKYKSKNMKFEEKHNTGYKEKTSAVEKALNNLTDEERDTLTDMDQYITNPRYDAVVSKIGEVTIKDFSKVLKGFVDDVLIDIKSDYAEDEKDFPTLSKDAMMLFTNEVKAFIRPKLLENS
ncbi:RNA ligase [Acinetobacter phage vB_AbaM_D22]|nr:RNA ligase [Acinetobacter phage vB_AbaM_D22]